MNEDERRQALAYITSMLTDLRKAAEAAQNEDLAYLISIAEAEAKSVRDGPIRN